MSLINILKESIIISDIRKYLIESKYLFHYTLTDNLENILDEGLIPRKNPMSYYQDGSNAIFLTTSHSLYNANLPQELVDEMDDYYDNEDDYETKPITRLWIDISTLDFSKFIWDDDYILNKYDWNKAETDNDKIIESLDIWGSIAYKDKIDKRNIFKYDFEYQN